MSEQYSPFEEALKVTVAGSDPFAPAADIFGENLQKSAAYAIGLGNQQTEENPFETPDKTPDETQPVQTKAAPVIDLGSLPPDLNGNY